MERPSNNLGRVLDIVTSNPDAFAREVEGLYSPVVDVVHHMTAPGGVQAPEPLGDHGDPWETTRTFSMQSPFGRGISILGVLCIFYGIGHFVPCPSWIVVFGATGAWMAVGMAWIAGWARTAVANQFSLIPVMDNSTLRVWLLASVVGGFCAGCLEKV